MNTRQIPIFFSLPVIILFLLCSISLAQLGTAVPEDSEAVPLKTGTVGGRFVVKNGGSMAGGNVVFYSAGHGPPPKMTQYIRVPNINSEILPDGSFSAKLPVGKYYFGAIKRNSGKNYGKPQAGDFWFRYREENSVTLKEFSINEGEHIDFGALEAFPGWKERNVHVAENTSIEGAIFDVNGKPVEKGVVFAYLNPQMRGQIPQFVSKYTGPDGKYSLPVAGDSTYYLMARGVLGGGKLAVGEIIGVYGEKEPVSISVKTGETVVDKDIKVFVVEPRGPREKFEATENIGMSKEGGATGNLMGEVVMADGLPLNDAFVYLFRADEKQSDDMRRRDVERSWWKFDQVAGQVDSNGKFNVEVPVGNYYLTIIKRTSGMVLEPLQEGDSYYLHRVSAGSNQVVAIQEGEETNLGKLVGSRYTALGVTDYPNINAIASIYGKVTDSKGKPVSGAYLLVYSEPDRLGPPLFSAGPSLADGSYKMMFYEEGTYYLVAKLSQESGPEKKGIPQPDILLGRYGGENTKPVVIRKNDIKKGIDIVLQPVGPPKG